MHLADFVNTLGVTYYAELYHTDEKGFHWKVQLTLNGADINVKYHCGLAWQQIRAGRTPWRDATWNEICVVKAMKKAGEFTLKTLRPKPPTALDVLQSLHSDAQSVQNNASFKDWANDLGYNPDSIKARKMYRACLEIDRKLRRLFGDRYQQFMECEPE